MQQNTIAMSKVPEVTFIFWIIKVLATTLGETAGDAFSMSMNLGYLLSTGIFAMLFLIAVGAQLTAKQFIPSIYWITIITTTTVGTTLADYTTRDLGIGYTGGSALLLSLLLTSLIIWHIKMGSIAINTVNTPKVEIFYWITIMFSQTLGTALGDWTADTAGLGYLGAGAIFSGFLLLILIAYRFSQVSHTLLFWAAFILTRPLGAVIGDFLDKPISKGGLELSRYSASLTLVILIVICIVLFPQNSAKKAH